MKFSSQVEKMQQPPHVIPMVPAFPPTGISTELIQKHLDENKKLIMAILENQNLGKLVECAQYQALLQKNLMYLAAIADSQPQAPTSAPASSVAPQMASQPAMQPPAYFMQHPQAGGTMPHQATLPGMFPPRGPLQLYVPQLQDPEQQQRHQLHQQAMRGHMGIRPMPINNNGLQHAVHHPETVRGTGGNVGSNDARGGSKLDGSDVRQGSHGSSAGRHGGGDGKHGGK